MNNKINVRFAPSPTGHLHIGGLRAALFNYIFAKQNGGNFFLRIEDTDFERSNEEFTKAIIDAFKWVNIKSDCELVYQSKRLDLYKEKINLMLKLGKIYECEEPDENGIIGKVIKCKVDKQRKNIKFNDLIRGEISFSTCEIDDFIIVRSDGTPLYNLVVVIDDIDMKISHVIRGEEHLSNTPKQILLYEALGEELPIYAHLPLILGKDGKKLSKRDAATAVIDYKKMGILPEALLCYLMRLGWSHGDQEIFTFDELLKYFNLNKVHPSGAVFDIKKLFWVNSCFIKNLSDQDIFLRVLEYNLMTGSLKNLSVENKLKCVFLYKNRVENLVDLINFCFNIHDGPKDKEFKNNIEFIEIEKHKNIIIYFVKNINSLVFSTENLFKDFIKDLCEKNSIEQSIFFKLLRFYILGEPNSPSIFQIINIIGFEETKNRILKNI